MSELLKMLTYWKDTIKRNADATTPEEMVGAIQRLGWRGPAEIKKLESQRDSAYDEGKRDGRTFLDEAREDERKEIIAYLVGVRATCLSHEGDIVTSIIQHLKGEK